MKSEMQELFFRMEEIADDDDQTLVAAVDALYELLMERNMYRARCLAAAKQMDEMTLRLQALEARRTKANEA